MTPTHIAMALAVPLIWGFGLVYAKAALDWFPPILLMAFRFGLTALILVWFVKIPRGILLKIAFIALISATLHYSLTFTGLSLVDASTAALIIQLEGPMVVLMAAVFLKEHITRLKVVGVLIAFSGVTLIAGEPRFDGLTWPLLILLVGSAIWAAGQVMIRKLAYRDGMGLIAWIAVFATPQLFVISFLIEGDPLPYIKGANWIVWSAVIYLGIVMTAVGYTLWYRLLAMYPAPTVAPFLLLVPVASVAGSVVILGERLTERTMLGGLIVIVGVALVTWQRRNHPRTPKTSGS